MSTISSSTPAFASLAAKSLLVGGAGGSSPIDHSSNV
jgi:hypothetical protein